MGKTLKELAQSTNGGYAMEAILALEKHCKRDGANGHEDLVVKGKKVEVKYFRVAPAVKDANGKTIKKAVYNSCHGFTPRKDRSVKKQLWTYCKGFDYFLICHGPTPEEAEIVKMAPEEAYEWLLPRIQYSATYGIRFCWCEKLREDNMAKRFATLEAEGYKL